MSALPKSTLTPQAYLAMERASETRHEYYHGETFAMSGASRKHNTLAGNLFASLHAQFSLRHCSVFISDMRVRIPKTPHYTYPDVVALCGEPHFEDDVLDTLLNPMVIVEILSPSTEKYDRAEKFAAYRTLPSLQEYVLISQEQILVEHFLRQPDFWQFRPLQTLADTLNLPSVEAQIPLAEIYAKISFEADDSAEK